MDMYNTVSLANSGCVKEEEILKKYSLSINEFNHEKALKEARNNAFEKERNQIRDNLVKYYSPLLQNCDGKLFTVHITPKKSFLRDPINKLYTAGHKESFVIDLYELLAKTTAFHLSRNAKVHKNPNRKISGCFVVEQRDKEGGIISPHIHAIWRIDASIKVPFNTELMESVIAKGSMQIGQSKVPFKKIIKDIQVEQITESKGGLRGALQYQNKWAVDGIKNDRAATWFTGWTNVDILENIEARPASPKKEINDNQISCIVNELQDIQDQTFQMDTFTLNAPNSLKDFENVVSEIRSRICDDGNYKLYLVQLD